MRSKNLRTARISRGVISAAGGGVACDAGVPLRVPDLDVLIDIWSIARDIVPRDFREYWDRSFVQWCYEFIAGRLRSAS